MFKNKRIAAHIITDPDNPGFSPQEYSKFKYGDTRIAHLYGQELFDFFQKKIGDQFDNKRPIVVYSSPYSYLPTSSYHMTSIFYKCLQDYLINHEMDNSLRFGKVERCQTYTADYGAMSAHERFELIQNDTYSIDEKPDEEAILLFLDDISITGSHQLVVEKLLCEKSIKNESYFLYYAILENKDVNPTYENVLNYAFVKDIQQLIPILISKYFKNTTRTTKYILSLSEAKLAELVAEIKENDRSDVLEEFIRGAILNQYHLIDEYKNNLVFLKNIVSYESSREM
jgi:hypothetical protein